MSAVTLGAKLKQLNDIQSKFQLMDQFTHDIQSNQHSVSYLRDRWNDLFGKSEDMCPKMTKIMASTECLSPEDAKNIMDEIQQAKVQIASDTVILGAIASAAIILVQVWRLREVWVAVKDAKNVVHESGSKINEINANIDQLNTWATELRGLIEQYEDGTRSDQQKKKLMKSIRLKISRMNTTYVDTRCMICKLFVFKEFLKCFYEVFTTFATFIFDHQLNSK
jgi:CRISPR/Cas system CSM-associated protein Csm2 small subunit